MGVKYELIINKPVEGVHRAGKPVSGVVKYAVDKPTEFEHIVLSFEGKSECKISSGKVGYLSNEELISESIQILENPEKSVTAPDVYEHPFEFVLPENIPSTLKLNCLYDGYIRYNIKLESKLASFFSLNKKLETEIFVIGNVEPVVPVRHTYSIVKALFVPMTPQRQTIFLKVQVSKLFLSPGEDVEVKFHVVNDSDVIINSIQTELVRRLTFKWSEYNKRNIFRKTYNKCTVETESVLANSEVNLSSVIHTLPKLYTLQHSKIIAVEFALKVTMKLPLPHVNKSLKIPIVIGESWESW